MKTKMKMVKYGVLGSLAVAGTAAGLAACGSGIGPSIIEEAATDKVSISPVTGNIKGGFVLTVSKVELDLTGATVKVGGSDCITRAIATASETEYTCYAPAKDAGAYDVVVTNAAGESETLEGALTYESTVKFSRDVQHLFDEPLTDGSVTNNSACIVCHSPSQALTTLPVATAVDCATTPSVSTDCQGRGDLAKLKTASNSFAAGSAMTAYGGTLFSAVAVTTFPKGDFVEAAAASGWTAEGLVAAKLSFANSFNTADTGYSFVCDAVKYALQMNGSGVKLATPIDITTSKLYAKVRSTALGGSGNMPKNDATKGVTDLQRNPVSFTQSQLDLLSLWAEQGYNCSE